MCSSIYGIDLFYTSLNEIIIGTKSKSILEYITLISIANFNWIQMFYHIKSYVEMFGIYMYFP